MTTLHCALGNGADLYVNERQKIRHYRTRSAEEKKREECQFENFFTSRGACVNCAIIAMCNRPTLARTNNSRSQTVTSTALSNSDRTFI